MKFIITIVGLVWILLLLVVVLSPWTIMGKYSEGERAGLLNKISKKGIFCKTWEGYLLVGNGQNVAPEYFYFTIKDEELAKRVLNKVSQVSKLEYNQKLVKSPCWGESGYEVINIKE